MAGPVVDILMYHGINDAPGPTNIAPAEFAMQMRLLRESELALVTMDDLTGGARLAPRSVAVTFDDGFADFADAAWPVLRDLDIRPIVYVPTAHVGGDDAWEPAANARRPLMNWRQIEALAARGVLFGSHSVSHADLSRLQGDALVAELEQSGERLQEMLGHPVRHFAAPYGRSTPAVRAAIAGRYDSSVGVRLAQARPRPGALHDLPRIEMHYFRDPQRWQRHLRGDGNSYLAGRGLLRNLRRIATGPWS